MTHTQPVSDFHSNLEEHVQRLARLIGVGAKNKLFAAVYRGKRHVKTVEELHQVTGLSKKRVLTLGKILDRAGAFRLVTTRPGGGRVFGYEKIRDVINEKDRILRLAANRHAREVLPTKRKPKVSVKGLHVKVPLERIARGKSITIDEVSSFSRVGKVKARSVPDKLEPPRLPELQFKHAVRFIIGDKSKAQDWGGEYNDLVTTHVTLGKRRVRAAFAFKGPGKTGVLTPAMMGKNGNQIQRLVNSPSAPEVVFVQYEGEIDETVEQQLRTFANEKAREEQRTIRYGTIALVDSYRLRLAYGKCFEKSKRLYGRKRMSGRQRAGGRRQTARRRNKR